MICKEKVAQDNTLKNVIGTYEQRKKKDLEIIPTHWKPIFEIDFMQALLVRIDFVGLDINIIISTVGREKYDILLKNIKVLYNETNVTSGVIYYAETILNKDNLEFNLLTNFNELSIIAQDIHINKIN